MRKIQKWQKSAYECRRPQNRVNPMISEASSVLRIQKAGPPGVNMSFMVFF